MKTWKITKILATEVVKQKQSQVNLVFLGTQISQERMEILVQIMEQMDHTVFVETQMEVKKLSGAIQEILRIRLKNLATH